MTQDHLGVIAKGTKWVQIDLRGELAGALESWGGATVAVDTVNGR